MADCIMYRKYSAGGENAYVAEIYNATVGGTGTVEKLVARVYIDKNVYDAGTAQQKSGALSLTLQALITNTASLSAPVEVT